MRCHDPPPMSFPLDILAFVGRIALHFLTYLGQLADLAKELLIT